MRASQKKQVAVIGSGIAGLTVADELARRDVGVTVIEKGDRPGGHAARLACKATDQCVHCGACLVNDRLRRISGADGIELLTNTSINSISREKQFDLGWQGPPGNGRLAVDALVVATGFSAYNPTAKNFAYGRLPNVITSLEAEQQLVKQGMLTRPSDGRPPDKIGYIQCVGSRDRHIGHPWCSRICCGSALRTLQLIRHRRPETRACLFYIDIQTFGHAFQIFYEQARRAITMIRAIPGEILAAANDGLQLLYFDNESGRPQTAELDLVVLSIGLAPNAGNRALAQMLAWPLGPEGFLVVHGEDAALPAGIFIAGTARAPMSIAASMADAQKTAADLLNYLTLKKGAA